MTLTLDVTMLVLMFFAFIAGAACGLAYLLLESAGAFIFGIIFAIAGHHGSTSGPKRSKGGLFTRMAIYVALCVGAFFIVSAGHAVAAYTCGIVGAFCFPVAVFKAFERS